MPAPTCPACGTQTDNPDAAFCASCGASLTEGVRAAATGPGDSVAARLRAVRECSDYAAALQHTPPTTGGKVGFILLIVAGVVFAGFAVLMSIPLLLFDAGLLGMFTLPFVLAGIGIAVLGIYKLVHFSKAPLECFPALVAGERERVTHSEHGGSTSYFVTVEDEHANRRECRARPHLAGAVSQGDVGVAYVKAGYLLDFRRIRM